MAADIAQVGGGTFWMCTVIGQAGLLPASPVAWAFTVTVRSSFVGRLAHNGVETEFAVGLICNGLGKL